MIMNANDDLYGKKAAESQVTNVAPFKANRKGHTADSIANALFRITIAV